MFLLYSIIYHKKTNDAMEEQEEDIQRQEEAWKEDNRIMKAQEE